MSFNEALATRTREILQEYGEVDERKMFGGLALMIQGYMCCGVIGDDLMVRLGQDAADAALKEEHVRPMDFTGRPMKGYVFVAPPGIRTERMLRRWVRAAFTFVEGLPPR